MKLRNAPIPLETKLRVITDYNAGIGVQQILDRNHISVSSLYRILKEKIRWDKENRKEVKNV